MQISPFGILLVNLGTPLSPSYRDVYRYLIEFLTDEKVIDLPWIWRQILVRARIVPFRYRQSAKYYQSIWTSEGSPLLYFGERVKKLLQKNLGEGFHLELAMRYQYPSIDQGLKNLMEKGIKNLMVLPMFPQYTDATTGSIYQKTMELLGKYPPLHSFQFIKNFPEHPLMIEAFRQISLKYPFEAYDHILFSFHGLPRKQILKADRQQWCLQKKECCHSRNSLNDLCYMAQCFSTAKALVNACHLPEEKYSLSFQSRLGKDPWLQPYTNEALKNLAHQGKKKVLVFCPSFICDCLETLYEIGIEYKNEFLKEGGEKLDLVEGLNDHPVWIEALKNIILNNKIK